MSMNLSSKLVSRLGSPNSRIPLATKDIFNSAGYTYFSYDSGGGIEAKDRLVDEVGTGAIWLGGIPLYRKIIDKTVFKKAGISPDVDIRVIKDKDYLKKALENAPTDKIKDELETAGKNITKTKNLNLLKFGAALGLTMLSYGALTKAKQFMTKKNIEKEFFKEQLKENKVASNGRYSDLKFANPQSGVFSEFEKRNDKTTPSFGSLNPSGIATEFVLNPIKNMIILDSAISGQRIACARTKEERKEYGIKEGSFLFFVYGADALLKKGINAASSKLLKTPIDLEADFLSSNLAEKVLKDKEAQNGISEFVKKFGSSKETKAIYDFIFDNPDHIIVKSAQKSGIISTVKNAEGKLVTDSRKFIDAEKVKTFGKDLSEFVKNGNAAKDANAYLNKVKGLKVASTLINVAACCFALGYAVPKFIYSQRKNQNGEAGFHVKNAYMQQLKEQQQTL